MQKEISVVDDKKGIVRITTLSERWYAKQGTNETTGLPEFKFYPSSTWIAGHYPKGTAFYKWLAQNGWNESESIKESAGRRGRQVHQATELLEKNGSLSIDEKLVDDDGKEQPLSTEALDGILSFQKWHDEVKPELLANEMTVFGENYAGTLDRIYRIDGVVYIVDIKTSKQIWEEHKLQIASYSHAEIDYNSLGITKSEWDARKLAVLQLGYPLNKNKYKMTIIEDKYELFKVARMIWQNENENAKPLERDYPLTIKLNRKEK